MSVARIGEVEFGVFGGGEGKREGFGELFRAASVAEIAAGQRDWVSLGNLEAHRDWGFAGDFVDAMWRILQADEADDWVVGTGEDHSVREFCEHAFAHVGIDIEWTGSGTDEVGRDRASGATRVVVNPRYFRPAEVDRLLADSTKARRELGWQPKVGVETSIGQYWEYLQAQENLSGILEYAETHMKQLKVIRAVTAKRADPG